jgi:hypothetical protein
LADLADLLEKDRKARVKGNGILSESDLKVAHQEAADLYKALNSNDVGGKLTQMVNDDADLRYTLTVNRESVVQAQSLSHLAGQEFKPIGRNPAPKPSGVPTKLRGFCKTFGIAGGVASAAQAPSYIRGYGYAGGSWELFKDVIDLFGFHDLMEPQPVLYA